MLSTTAAAKSHLSLLAFIFYIIPLLILIGLILHHLKASCQVLENLLLLSELL